MGFMLSVRGYEGFEEAHQVPTELMHQAQTGITPFLFLTKAQIRPFLGLVTSDT